MNNLIAKYTIVVILISMISCNKIERKPLHNNNTTIDIIEQKEIFTDTINSKIPIGIGNDLDSLSIIGVRSFENDKLVNSEFTINLEDSNYNMVKPINEDSLTNTEMQIYYVDSTDLKFHEEVVIKSIEYDGIRSNTLYFNAVFNNKNNSMHAFGRFNLFYRTKKKSKLYGVIIDSIR